MLEGRNILVVGASGKLGLAFCRRALAQKAGHIIAHGNSGSDRLEGLAAEAGPTKFTVLSEDLSSAEGQRRLCLAAAQALAGARLDFMVCCAGLLEAATLSRTEPELARKLLEVNCLAPMALTRQAVALGASGVVVFSDIAASMTWSSHAFYGASKAALEYLIRCAAKEYAPVCRVNCIAPGVILEEGDTKLPISLSKIPIGRAGMVDEAVDAVMFLLAPDGYMTGQVLRLDGGRSLC